MKNSNNIEEHKVKSPLRTYSILLAQRELILTVDSESFYNFLYLHSRLTLESCVAIPW